MNASQRSELLAFIARHEPLEATLRAFPELSRGAIGEALLEMAGVAPPPKRPLEPKPAPPTRAPERETAAAIEGPHPRLRLHSDGAARGNPGPAGAGAVVMTPDGRILERLGRYLGVQTNNVAEYRGLLLGLHRAVELGAREVEVVADSELMIRQLQGRYQVKNAGLKPLFEEAKRLLARFSEVRLRHVPRAQNKEADEMSNRAIDERMG